MYRLVGLFFLVLALIVLVAVSVVQCNPPATPPPTAVPPLTVTRVPPTIPSGPTNTPTRTVAPPTATRTATPTRVPPTVKPPTRTPRPEDSWTTVEEPKDLLFWRNVLWVVSKKGVLHVIDPRDMKVVYSRGTGGKEAWGIAVATFGDKSKIAVTHGDGTLTVIDPDQMLVVGQLHIEGQLGRPAALGRYLFVPVHDKWSVAVVDLFDPEKPEGKLVKTVKTEAAPFAAAANFTTGEVLVTHRDANKVAILDGQTGRLKGLFPIEGARSLYSLAVGPTAGTIAIAYAAVGTDADKPNRFAVFAHKFTEKLHDLETCSLGEGGQIVVEEPKIIVACHGENRILSYSLVHSGVTKREIITGHFPFGLAITWEDNSVLTFVGLKSRGANASENKVKKVFWR